MAKIFVVTSEVFTSDELRQYESRILDCSAPTEQEASRFFREFPKFLTIGGYIQFSREVLLYDGSGNSIYRVDFLRRRYGERFWDVVELKSPKVPIVVKRGKHWKFSSDIELGLQEAQDYREFLEESVRRLELERKSDILIFRPQILLIGGRSSEEIDPIALKSLVSRYNNMDVKSYDDIYRFAKESYNSSLVTVPILQRTEVTFPTLEEHPPSWREAELAAEDFAKTHLVPIGCTILRVTVLTGFEVCIDYEGSLTLKQIEDFSFAFRRLIGLDVILRSGDT